MNAHPDDILRYVVLTATIYSQTSEQMDEYPPATNQSSVEFNETNSLNKYERKPRTKGSHVWENRPTYLGEGKVGIAGIRKAEEYTPELISDGTSKGSTAGPLHFRSVLHFVMFPFAIFRSI